MKWPGWTGVGGRTYEQPDGTVVQPSKTAWDWLQLLIVPAILVGAVTLYNSSQTAQQNRRSVQTAQDSTLDAYFLQMSDLMLHDNLLHAAPGSPVRAVADAITGGAISRLNTARQIEVATFLSDARVPRANLPGANLPGANLIDAKLSDANLVDADLSFADLSGAQLNGADLGRADLGGADLSYTNLRDAQFDRANLSGAYLNGANLSGADLTGANLSGAHLVGANLSSAFLSNVNLSGANLGGANLGGASFYHTTCPNGKITNSNC